MRKHQLYYVRMSLGMTQKDLAAVSGIAPSTISRIERNISDYKVNSETASAICKALQKRVGEIFHPIELSHIGRTPKTGVPIGRREARCSHEVVCPNCHLSVPVRPECMECDSTLPLASGM